MSRYIGLAYFLVAYIISVVFRSHHSFWDWFIPEQRIAIALAIGWFSVNFFLVLFERIDSHITLENTLEKERKEFKEILARERLEFKEALTRERKEFKELIEKRAKKDECVKKLSYWLKELSNRNKEGGYNLIEVMKECVEALRQASVSESVIFDLTTPPRNINDWIHFDSKVREIITYHLKY